MDSESERKTRRTRIDPKLASAGWSVAPFDASRSLSDYPQCAIEEYETDNGPAALRGIRETLTARTRMARASAAGRLRRFHIGEIKERDYKLDITWLKDESLEDADELPEPEDLAAEAITELEADLKEIAALVEASVS